MIQIREIDKAIMNWAEGIRQAARCDILFQAFGTAGDLAGHFTDRTPCENFDRQWLFWIDQFELLNFGVEEGKDETASEVYAARLSYEPDYPVFHEEPPMLKDWSCWTISVSSREHLEHELHQLRWNLELNEPDKTLDPRPFLVCLDDVNILRRLADLIAKIQVHLPDSSREALFAGSFIELLGTVPDLSGKPDFIAAGKKYFCWHPPFKLSGIILHEDLGFSCEINPAAFMLEWSDLANTDWCLERGSPRDRATLSGMLGMLKIFECMIDICDLTEGGRGFEVEEY